MWTGQALGVIKATQHRIDLNAGARPVCFAPRGAGHTAREAEKAEVKRQLEADFIELTSSEWGFPVVLVPNKDGTFLFCVDYRLLSIVNMKDSYSLPRMDECIDSLGFFRWTVEHPGHEINPGRLDVMDAHTRELRAAHFPTTRTQVRRFVRICNVFRWFATNIARVAAPLTDLMGSTAPVLVPPASPLQQQAFDRLKVALTTPWVLALPRRGRKYVLDVDACGTQVDASLLQEQDDRKLQPVAFISRRLGTNELPYGITEKECLVVVWASLKLRPYFEGDPFLVRTDHDCLRWILNIEGSGKPRLARCRLRLSELEFDVAYKPGMPHYMADSISHRMSGGSDETAFDDAVRVFAVRANTVRGLDAANYVGGPTVRGIDRDAALSAQADDRYCQDVVKALNAGRRIAFFEDSNGILRRRAAPAGAHQRRRS